MGVEVEQRQTTVGTTPSLPGGLDVRIGDRVVTADGEQLGPIGIAQRGGECRRSLQGLLRGVRTNRSITRIGHVQNGGDVDIQFEVVGLDVLGRLPDGTGTEAGPGPERHPAVVGNPVDDPIQDIHVGRRVIELGEAAEGRHAGESRRLACIGQSGATGRFVIHTPMFTGSARLGKPKRRRPGLVARGVFLTWWDGRSHHDQFVASAGETGNLHRKPVQPDRTA